MALFHHFFLQFLHIIEISQKTHNTTTSRPPVPCILQILTTFNLYSVRPRMSLSVNNKQKVRQAMVKISRGGVATTPYPPWPDMSAKRAWPSKGQINKKILLPATNFFKIYQLKTNDNERKIFCVSISSHKAGAFCKILIASIENFQSLLSQVEHSKKISTGMLLSLFWVWNFTICFFCGGGVAQN